MGRKTYNKFTLLTLSNYSENQAKIKLQIEVSNRFYPHICFSLTIMILQFQVIM